MTTSQGCLCPLLRKEGTGQASRDTYRCTVSLYTLPFCDLKYMARHLNFTLLACSPSDDSQETQENSITWISVDQFPNLFVKPTNVLLCCKWHSGYLELGRARLRWNKPGWEVFFGIVLKTLGSNLQRRVWFIFVWHGFSLLTLEPPFIWGNISSNIPGSCT